MGQPSSSNRREFLQGQAAVRALGDLIPQGPLAPVGVPDSWLQFSRRAMACEFQVWLRTSSVGAESAAALEALELISALEAQLTVYRDDSEVSQLNQRAALGPVAVESRLFDLLTRAVVLHQQTNGAYDIATGALTKAWGFFRREGAMPDDALLTTALQSTGSRHLQLDAQRQTVQFLQPGLELNLGSIGKGYALDRAAEQMRAAGLRDFLWHGGASSVLASGHRATPANAQEPDASQAGWEIGLLDPLRPRQRLGTVRLVNQALGTSGSQVQFFRQGGARYGHILDPRTGWPAQGMLSATVVAPTAAEADALSTAFYVLGPSESAAYCAQHPEVGAVLTFCEAETERLQTTVLNLPPERWQPTA